ncbi:hypothetical protein J6590_014931 [Homalodisca vitripennis]|nr:hypothetical protein J6590_014931 [Homalodisca vitripennis]
MYNDKRTQDNVICTRTRIFCQLQEHTQKFISGGEGGIKSKLKSMFILNIIFVFNIKSKIMLKYDNIFRIVIGFMHLTENTQKAKMTLLPPSPSHGYVPGQLSHYKGYWCCISGKK